MKLIHVKKAFNKAADQYNASCILQLKTGDRLLELLKNNALKGDSMLDAGCGTGILTDKLASAFNYKAFYAIDIADQLLIRAKEKLAHRNVHIELADYNDMNHLNMLFDIIYANLSLHWSSNFIHTLVSLHRNLNTNGILAFSIPLKGTFDEIKNDCSIHSFFELSTVEKYLLHSAFKIINTTTQEITFNFDNLSEALKSIKIVGANYVDNRKKQNFKKLKKFILSNSSSFKLSYCMGYFIAKKAYHGN